MKSSAANLTSLQMAVTRVALLDMDLAINVYLEAGRHDLNALATSIVEMSTGVDKTTQQLQAADSDMSSTAKRSSDRSAAVAVRHYREHPIYELAEGMAEWLLSRAFLGGVVSDCDDRGFTTYSWVDTIGQGAFREGA